MRAEQCGDEFSPPVGMPAEAGTLSQAANRGGWDGGDL